MRRYFTYVAVSCGHNFDLYYCVSWITISSMKKSIVVIIALLILLVISWVGAFLWVRSERQVSLDRLNRIDYISVQDAMLSQYVQEDIGLPLSELREKDPADTGLGSFPELYLVARVMNSTGNGETSLKYFAEADKKLDTYHKKESVAADFYLAYVSTMGSDSDDIEALASRAEKAVETSSLTDEEKVRYRQSLQIYVTGEAPSEEER